jgi:hypothetical protein
MCAGVEWIHLTGCSVHSNEPSGSTTEGKILDWLNVSFSRGESALWT